MEDSNPKKVVFAFPEDELTTIEVIDRILSNNNLAESDDEFVDKDERGIEPRLIIVRDAAITLFEKKIPETKLVELLAKHLETSPETAAKIVADIKQKLIPFAKVINIEEESRPVVSSQKPESKPSLPYDKKVETKSVEENAKKMEGNLTDDKEKIISAPAQQAEPMKAKTVLPQEAPKGPDTYREPLE